MEGGDIENIIKPSCMLEHKSTARVLSSYEKICKGI